MNAEEAKRLVEEHHNNEISKELVSLRKRIEQNARLGKVTFNTDFKHEVNIQTLKDDGFRVVKTGRHANTEEERYDVFYDISWGDE